MDTLYGLPVVINPYMIIGYEQARKHKKKRINKKWAKRYGDKPVYDMKNAYMIKDQMIVMSQGAWDKIKKKFEENKTVI